MILSFLLGQVPVPRSAMTRVGLYPASMPRDSADDELEKTEEPSCSAPEFSGQPLASVCVGSGYVLAEILLS